MLQVAVPLRAPGHGRLLLVGSTAQLGDWDWKSGLKLEEVN